MDKLRARLPAVRLILERVRPKIVTRLSQDGLSASLIFKVPHYRILLLVLLLFRLHGQGSLQVSHEGVKDKCLRSSIHQTMGWR